MKIKKQKKKIEKKVIKPQSTHKYTLNVTKQNISQQKQTKFLSTAEKESNFVKFKKLEQTESKKNFIR